MTIRTRSLAALALTATAIAFASPATARPQAGGIRAVDFRNFTYPPSCVEGKPVVVKDGSYTKDVEDDKVYFEVQPGIAYGDLDGDGRDEAAVVTLCNTGGTGQFTEGYVYGMRGAKPVILAELDTGDRADGGISRVEIKDGLLYVSRYGVDEGGGACCPQFVETIGFKLRGKTLVPAGKPLRVVMPDQEPDPTPERVAFARGATKTSVRGTTSANETYLVGARAGQRMRVTLSAADDAAEFTVSASDGTFLAHRRTGAVWSAVLPTTGDYHISVNATSGEAVRFTLEVAITN